MGLSTLKPRIATLGPRLGGVPATALKRTTGRTLQTRRLKVWLASDGCCAACGRVVAMSDFALDHNIALVNGGEDTEANSQVLCLPCHEIKTIEDMAMARGER